MLVLKCRVAYVNVRSNKKDIFHRQSPIVGGVTSAYLLDALGIQHGVVGDYVLRAPDLQRLEDAILCFHEVDLRHSNGKPILSQLMQVIATAQVEVEKLC